jgi:hypothetical protein
LDGLTQFSERLTASSLSRDRSLERTVKMMEKIERFSETDILRVLNGVQEDMKPECAAGCDHCCYQWVRCGIPEAIYTWEGIRKNYDAEGLARLASEISVYAEMIRSVKEGVVPQTPCPLLDDHRCSVYEHRPLACRGTMSMDAAACLQGRLTPAETRIPYILPMMYLVGALRSGLKRGAAAAGMPSYEVALVLALEIMMRDETAVDRYLAGEDVFASADADLIPTVDLGLAPRR